MATRSNVKRKCLMLSQRIQVIKEYEKGGRSSRSLAKEFGVGKTQIENIIKRKREHLDDFANNTPETQKRRRYTGYEEINELCWEFYCDRTSQGKSTNGPMLQGAALTFAKDLGVTGFKASNGWLESFRKRHNISTIGKSSGSYREDKAVVQRRGQEVSSTTDGQVHTALDLSIDNSCDENSESQDSGAKTKAADSCHLDDVLLGSENREQNESNITSRHATPDISTASNSYIGSPATTEKDLANRREGGDTHAATLPVVVKEEPEETEGEWQGDSSDGDIPTGPIKNFSMAIKAVNEMKLFCLNEGLGSEMFTLYELENRFISLWMKRQTTSTAI
ncbi:uncharacterized protein [Branchiostoma lanceolatum]|uniref:uncharacterized protein n=1 Tax=Branchiostoma lanceolatum TaxID=7740 RepID=UPI0011331EAB